MPVPDAAAADNRPSMLTCAGVDSPSEPCDSRLPPTQVVTHTRFENTLGLSVTPIRLPTAPQRRST